MSKIGRFVSLPNQYSDYGTFKDSKSGDQYTVLKEDMPKKVKEKRDYAYEVEIWENNSGNAHSFKEDD